jgi:hypothetical protein
MPAIEWVIPHRVLKVSLPFKFEDSVSVLIDNAILEYLDAASAPLYLIVDLREVKVHPSISTIMGWKHLRHRNLKHVILIGITTNPIIRFISNMMTRITGLRITNASTFEDALALIAHMEPQSLNPNL